MSFIIRKISSDLLFYVDRSKTKLYWWSYKLSLAKIYETKEQAESAKSKLKYGNFEIISYSNAEVLRRNKDLEHEKKIEFTKSTHFYDSFEHPFSSGALGQD